MRATFDTIAHNNDARDHKLSIVKALLIVVNLAGFSVMIGGCESTTNKSVSSVPPISWSDRQEALEDFSNWLIIGKLAVIQPERSDNLVINQWRQINNKFDIHVSSGLLGLGATHISGTPQNLFLQQADEPSLQSFDPAELLRTTLGWSLPLDYLSFWIKGLPKPDTPAKLSFDDEGNPFQIDQNKWLVQLDRYRPTGGLILPGKVTLTKGEVKLKVIITNWTEICGNC